jgi:hypothetical protein
VERPVRVAQHGAGEDDQIGAALPDDLVGLRRIRDQPDGRRGDAGSAADRLRERHLVAGSERNRRVRDVAARAAVDDVDAAVAWYTKHLGFALLSNAAPAFADVTLGSLRLLLSGPKSSAGRAMPDGERPGPGGWNRIHLIVDDISAEVARLRAAGVEFRNDIVTGPPLIAPVQRSAGVRL